MKVAFGISWNDSKKGGALLLALAVTLTMASVPVATYQELSRSVSVIVRVEPGSGTTPREVVESLGGEIGRELEIINGFEAKVPADRLEELTRSDSISSVTLNSRVHLQHSVDGFNAVHDLGSVLNVTKLTRADKLWKKGITGAGVDIAMIDSGIVPVNGLSAPGKIINGPDLSFESQAENLRHLDTYGHGTHIAGLIAGRDNGSPGTLSESNHDGFSGIAPDARVVSVKVADATGATDVSQVLAGIDWVVQHRRDNGLNIRVLNLSFGTDGVQDYVLDPLTYAAEVAWHHGIVVVVSAGNSQFGPGRLNNPAYDPFVIAVGASDPGTTLGREDDTVPNWSARSFDRTVDLVAPGKSIVSLRDTNSFIDSQFPGGRVNSRFFRGSGTSQAAAIVSGAAALLLEHRPWMTPDQVKGALKDGATPILSATPEAQGEGQLDLARAHRADVSSQPQTFARATGTGSLEASRGSVHVTDVNGVPLTGEQDIFGATWDANSWSANSWSANSWSGGTWNNNIWSGEGWSANSWSANSWSANSWSANSWSGLAWGANSWSASSWSANSWSANSWSANSWSANSWSANSWSANSWSANSWSGSFWG
ncbi:MAG: S8 family serine peptidase [Actinobacteria bacterium]|nr:S8 family serine peptidase [Actinomycetota bacterium]